MWNKLVAILQEPASKRLGLAIVVSAVLHSLFFGNMQAFLPTIKQEMHTIEARIQMPKAAVAPAAEVPIAKSEPIEPIKEPPPVAEAPPEANTDAPSEPTELLPEPKVAEPIATEPQQVPIEIDAPSEEAQPVDAGLIINENAYQYIETEFDVRTQIDGSADGKAKITYNLIEGDQYSIKWLTEGTGFTAVFFPDLLQTSEGVLTKTGLQPKQYSYQFGKKADKSRSATFDWQAKKVMLQTVKGTKTEELPEGTQDLLSFMYQFMHVAPLQHMQLPIVNGKKLRIYDYSFEGEEQINSALGEIKTLHLLHSGNDEETTELWLAIDYQYVPVKIRKIENDGKVVEMAATRITTNRPVINQ
jgi:Protein of unknown function (DUF3108)